MGFRICRTRRPFALGSGRSSLQSTHWVDCFGCAEPLLTHKRKTARFLPRRSKPYPGNQL